MCISHVWGKFCTLSVSKDVWWWEACSSHSVDTCHVDTRVPGSWIKQKSYTFVPSNWVPGPCLAFANVTFCFWWQAIAWAWVQFQASLSTLKEIIWMISVPEKSSVLVVLVNLCHKPRWFQSVWAYRMVEWGTLENTHPDGRSLQTKYLGLVEDIHW